MGIRNWVKRMRGEEAPLGVRGERFAAEFLRRELGIRVLACNVLCPEGELDIVALDGEELVFVEVRTRSSEDFIKAEESIRRPKRETLRKAVRWFVRSRRLERYAVRIDTIGITWPKAGQPELRYMQNAFRLDGT